MHVHDLIQTERALGYRYEMGGAVEHYQWICPPCRRAMVALAQAQLWQPERHAVIVAGREQTPPMPVYVNPAQREGPLGEEDARNFHP
jgi:hypothetical protein